MPDDTPTTASISYAIRQEIARSQPGGVVKLEMTNSVAAQIADALEAQVMRYREAVLSRRAR